MTDDMHDYWLERTREELDERFPGEHPAILQIFDIAWSGWECDSRGALITRNGRPELLVMDQVNIVPTIVPTQLRERIAEYRRLVDETDAVLARYLELGGLEGPALDDAVQRDRESLQAREWRPGESDEEYAARLDYWGIK